MAATEPVTPRRTLAMCSPAPFGKVDQPASQSGPGHTLVPTRDGTDECPVGRTLERVGDHEVRLGLSPRALGDGLQLGLGLADFELELDEQATEAPRLAEEVHQFRGAHEAQPQLGLVAL